MTHGRLLFTLAWRNLWRYPRRTILTVLALGLGLAFLLFSLGLGDGSHEQMVANGIKLGGGHVVIQAEGYQRTRSQDLLLPSHVISTVDALLQPQHAPSPVHSISPRLLASGLLSSATNASGVGIVGVQPQAEHTVSLIPQRMIEGSYLGPYPEAYPNDEQASGLVIGAELAQKLKVRIGSKVVLMAQAVRVQPEADTKRTRETNGAGGEIQNASFRVVGIFRTGLREVDAYLVHLSLPKTQTFLGAGDQITQIAIFLHQESASVPTADVLRQQFSPTGIEVLTWREALAELAQFVWLDDAFNYVINGIILVMVALGVLNTMLMAVLERRYELGVCAALGLRPVQLLALVMYESLVLIILSLALGLALGLGVHSYFATYGLDIRLFTETDLAIAGTVFDPILYSSLSQARIIWAVSVVGALALLMAVYPGWKAARTELPGALRAM